MVGDKAQYVEVVVEKDGKIAFTGSLGDAKELFPGATEMNLQGRCMIIIIIIIIIITIFNEETFSLKSGLQKGPQDAGTHRPTSSPVHGGLDSADAFYHTVRLDPSKR